MGVREPCVCCGKDPIEADYGNVCQACFKHMPWRSHPSNSEEKAGQPTARINLSA